jgi:hypothetical protein
MTEGHIKAMGTLRELLTKYDSKNMDEVFIKLAG